MTVVSGQRLGVRKEMIESYELQVTSKELRVSEQVQFLSFFASNTDG
jgi:hypothetical protein